MYENMIPSLSAVPDILVYSNYSCLSRDVVPITGNGRLFWNEVFFTYQRIINKNQVLNLEDHKYRGRINAI